MHLPHGMAYQLQPQVIMGAKYRLKRAVEEKKTLGKTKPEEVRYKSRSAAAVQQPCRFIRLIWKTDFKLTAGFKLHNCSVPISRSFLDSRSFSSQYSYLFLTPSSNELKWKLQVVYGAAYEQKMFWTSESSFSGCDWPQRSSMLPSKKWEKPVMGCQLRNKSYNCSSQLFRS